ncbi:hypothetical protein EMCRGX_G010505 [Ephydatia muelleri]
METEVDFGSWTLVETVAWAKKAFGDDVSASFEEEGVDGETLELLAKCGTIEQYKACGLRYIKQQMQLKRLLNTDKRELEGSSSLEREMSSKKFDRKLKLLELRTISPEDRRIYLMTRNKINKATKEVWSGNDVPKFRGNEEEMKKLDKLVSDLLPICSCKYFGPQSIRQHILDSLQERRRKIKNGHDYRKNKKTPSGSVTKSKAADSTRSVPKDDLTADTTGSITKGPASDSTVHASAPTGPASDSTTLIDSGTTGTKSVTKDLPAKEIRSVTMNQATDSTDRESVTTESIIHVTSNSTESVPKDIASDAIATKCNKDQTGTGPVTKELVADTAALEILSVTSPEDLDQQQEDDIIDLSQKSAEVIISVAFGVMMMKQLTRQRLLTTLNNYMAQGDERRSLQSAPKASLLRPLAKLLLAKKIVVLSEGATLQNVKRQDVKVNGTLVMVHVTMVGVVIHRELYLYLPLSSPAASLNLTGALFFTRCSCIRSNKFKSQLLTTSSSSVTRLTPIKACSAGVRGHHTDITESKKESSSF